MEWVVVTVIIAIVGLITTVARPIVTLTQSITKLTTVVDRLEADLQEQRTHSRESHAKIWQHNEEQDERLDEHERRLHDLDGK